MYLGMFWLAVVFGPVFLILDRNRGRVFGLTCHTCDSENGDFKTATDKRGPTTATPPRATARTARTYFLAMPDSVCLPTVAFCTVADGGGV